MQQNDAPRQAAERLTLLAALGAVAAASLCCVVPFLLVSLGITGPWLARLQIFEPYRIPFDVMSIFAVGVAWAVHLARVRTCRTDDGCAIPQRVRRTRSVLLVSTGLIVILVAAPYAIASFGGS